MKITLHRIIALLAAFLLLPPTLSAASDGQPVRVGWYESVFNHTDQDGRRSGYAYEYQLRIAANTDWEYEYVEGSWAELFAMLERGEIDLLSDVSYTEERAQKMLFSKHDMGNEDYLLLALANDTTLSSTDLSTINGKRIGVNCNSYQSKLLRQWLKTNGIKAQVIEYIGLEADYLVHLQNHEIDLLATNTAFTSIGHRSCRPIALIGSADFYFAISKSRPELKAQIDEALDRILTNNTFYNRDLYEKYFARASFYNHLPSGEAKWLAQHGTIRIGYRDNYLPFCAQDAQTGEVSGLLGDFIERTTSVFSSNNLHIEAIAYPTINDALDAVARGEIDVAFPNGMSAYDTEKAGLLPADAVVKSAEMAVVRIDDFFHADGKVRAAINAENPNYLSLISEQYPNWELVHFPSTYECLKGVAENKADLLLTSNYRLGILNETIEEFNLKAVATGSVVPLTFATSKHQHLLYSLMSRLMHLMSDAEIHASLAKYSEVQRETTFINFAKNNMSVVFFSFLTIIAIFAFLLWRSQHEHKHAVAANKAKSKFLFNMSHDIRTPMNAIMGYSELMSKNLNNTVQCRHYLDKLHDSGEFLLNLINNVLEMARIESGKVELNEKPHRLSTALLTLKNLYEEMTEKKGIRLETSFDVHTECVYCDALKLNEIYLNLLSNAYKYTPKGGSIRVTSQELPGPKEGYITIKGTVSDTGTGMSKDFLPHLFEDFSREQTYTDNKIQGTGLGMSIVKHYVDLMGGTIEVESELGKGTTFTVIISHRIADASLIEDEEAIQINATANRGKRILLAEDNELNAEIAIEILKAAGYEADHAEDGAVCVEKYEKAEAGTYDAILMDIQMPNMDGYEASRYIRKMKDKKKAAIPIIAMTANAFDEDKKNAARAGMDAHLSKPIQTDLLISTLQEYIK